MKYSRLNEDGVCPICEKDWGEDEPEDDEDDEAPDYE